MAQLLTIAGAACFAAALLTGAWALLASEPVAAGGWRSVASLTAQPDAVRVRGRVLDAGTGWRSPRERRPCAWSVTWAVGTRQGVGATGRRSSGVEVFERSAAEVLVAPAGGGEPLRLDPLSLWVQVAVGGVPFGASAIDRELEGSAPHGTYAAWTRRHPGDRTAVSFQELTLEHGAEVTLVGRPATDLQDRPTLHGARPGQGVLVLQGDGADLAQAAGRAGALRDAGRRRRRLAAGLALAAVACLAAGAALGGG